MRPFIESLLYIRLLCMSFIYLFKEGPEHLVHCRLRVRQQLTLSAILLESQEEVWFNKSWLWHSDLWQHQHLIWAQSSLWLSELGSMQQTHSVKRWAIFSQLSLALNICSCIHNIYVICQIPDSSLTIVSMSLPGMFLLRSDGEEKCDLTIKYLAE